MQLFSMAFDEGDCVFKFKRCLFEYNGRQFMLYPGNENYYMSIDTIVNDSDDKDNAFKDIHEFLYLFGWRNGFSFQFLDAASMHARKSMLIDREIPFFRYPRRMHSIARMILMAPKSCSDNLKKMLSLYNDSRHTDNVFYRFLCLYKVLDCSFNGDQPTITNWINDTYKELLKKENTVLEYLNINVENPGYYFRETLRNAIAHAHLGKVSGGRDGLLAYKADDYAATIRAAMILDKLVQVLINDKIGQPNEEVVNVIFEEKQ